MIKNISDDTFDLIKGLSIFFVVSIHIVYSFFTPHSKPLLFEFYNYLTGLAVPFFYILGGFFFAHKYIYNQEPFTKEIYIKSIKLTLKRIVIPYYIFVLILFIYNALTGIPIYWPHIFFINSNTHGLYYLIIYTYSFLFTSTILFIFNKFNKKLCSFIIFILSLSFFLIEIGIQHENNVVFSHLPDISFYCSGIIVYHIFNYFNISTSKKATINYIIILIAYAFLLYVARKIFGPFPIITSAPPTIFRLIFCVLIFFIVINIFSTKFISYSFKKMKFNKFGQQSLFIFLIHPYFIKFFIPFIAYIYKIFSFNYNNNFFVITVLAISYLISIISLFTILLIPKKVASIFTR